jgi:hypothetical protein
MPTDGRTKLARLVGPFLSLPVSNAPQDVSYKNTFSWHDLDFAGSVLAPVEAFVTALLKSSSFCTRSWSIRPFLSVPPTRSINPPLRQWVIQQVSQLRMDELCSPTPSLRIHSKIHIQMGRSTGRNSPLEGKLMTLKGQVTYEIFLVLTDF